MRLRFTIGPVQEFVRQIRRTRDLWSSSFLLSYLSGCAMKGAMDHGGKPILPVVEGDQLFAYLQGVRDENPPRVGSLPNRFEIETDHPEEAARAATAAFNHAWNRICQAIWTRTLEPIAAKGQGTKDIFDRQTTDFWEIQWVAATDEQSMLGLLERRKEWRSRVPTVEPGDKCVIMPEFQELSGYVRARKKDAQDAFWNAVISHNRLNDKEMRENERLSAIAWVKRMYPRPSLVKDTIQWDPKVSSWYSTLHIAAKPWHEEVLARYPEAAKTYVELVLKHDPEAIHKESSSEAPDFTSLDANYLFIDALDNPDSTLIGLPTAPSVRQELKTKLLALYGQGEKNPIGPPSSFYALLLMDGDRVGTLLADKEFSSDGVSAALAKFTKEVPGIVNDYKGALVYAGGDDVLAMLPVTQALECAWKLRTAYQESFKPKKATTSASVVFAHIRRPLRQILEEAHRLLDDVAKDQNGRDSIAITVLHSGDRALEWVSTWDTEDEKRRIESLTALADSWRAKAKRRRNDDARPLIEGEIGTGLVYRIRELMGLLCGWPRWGPGENAEYSTGDAQKLLAAEIRRAMRATQIEDDDDEVAQRQAEEMAQRMLDVSHPIVRHQDGRIERKRNFIGLDGLLLALFLSTDGKERDHGAMEAGA